MSKGVLNSSKQEETQPVSTASTSSSARSELETTKHLQYIDSLRGIAVAGVIVAHVSGMLKVTGVWAALAFGAKGVQLFYIVSALTLMMSMAKRSRLEQRPLANFFIRKFFRIAPAFYLVLLVYCLLGWKANAQFTGIEATSVPHALAVMSFLNGWRPDAINVPVVGQWSIAVEMTFYLLPPCIFPLLTTFRRSVYAWWASIILYLFAYSFASHLAGLEGLGPSSILIPDFAYWWFPSQLPVFMCGIGVYFVVSDRMRFRQFVFAYLPGVLLVVAAHRLRPEIGMVPLVAAAIMSFVVAVSRWLPRLIVNPCTAFLGKVSFSAYLCHPLVLIVLRAILCIKSGIKPAVLFVIAFGMTIVVVCLVSYLMWRYIEVPGQRLGKLLIARLAA